MFHGAENKLFMEWKGFNIKKWSTIHEFKTMDVYSFLLQYMWAIGTIADVVNITFKDNHPENILLMPRPCRSGHFRINYTIAVNPDIVIQISFDTNFILSLIDWSTSKICNPHSHLNKSLNMFMVNETSSSSRNKRSAIEKKSIFSPSLNAFTFIQSANNTPLSLKRLRKIIPFGSLLEYSNGIYDYLLSAKKIHDINKDRIRITNIDSIESVNEDDSFECYRVKMSIEWIVDVPLLFNRGPPRKYSSNAERQKAYRNRKRKKTTIEHEIEYYDRFNPNFGNLFYTLYDNNLLYIGRNKHSLLGVFAKDTILAEQRITEFSGNITQNKKILNEMYSYSLDEGSYIDGISFPYLMCGLGSIIYKSANDYNCCIKKPDLDRKEYYVYAIRDIQKNEELILCDIFESN